MSDELARVLANPLRARLLFECQGEPTSPSRLAARLDEPLNLVSYHTQVLVRHGCLELVRTERRRGATEHFYRSIAGPIVEDEDWERLPRALRRAMAQVVLGAVTDEARAAALAGGFDGARAHLSRTMLRLDPPGRRAVSEVLRRVLDEVAEIQAACDERAEAGREQSELVVLHFAAGTGEGRSRRTP